MRTEKTNKYRKVTCHRDGTVTLWDVYAQQWTRTAHPSDDQLAAMPQTERQRVIDHCHLGDGG